MLYLMNCGDGNMQCVRLRLVWQGTFADKDVGKGYGRIRQPQYRKTG